MGILLRLNDKEFRHDDDRCRMRMEIHGVNNRHIEDRVDLLYKHLGLQIRTIPAVPEHKEVVKIEPLSSLDGDHFLMAAMNKAAAALKDKYDIRDAVVGKAPKSNKKRA